MKIAHVGTSVTPVTSTHGGALQRRQLEMAAVQAADGHEVVIFSPAEEDGSESLRGVKIEHVGLRLPRPGRDFEFLRAVRVRSRRYERFDILHAHGSPHAGRLTSRVARASVHSVDFFRYRWSGQSLVRRGYARQLQAFTLNLPVSDFCAREFGAYYPSVDNIQLLPNGVSLDQFRPSQSLAEEARVELGLPGGPLAIYLGRVCEQKGSDLLGDLSRGLRQRGADATVVAAGPPESFGMDGATSLTDDLANSGVVVTGAVDEALLPGLLSLATVALLPTRRDEMFGMAALEALACGTPVVASDLGGIPEAVGKGGLLFPVGDARSLTDCVERLLSDEMECASFAALGLSHAKTFAWRNIVNLAYDQYRTAMGIRNAPTK